MWLNSIGAGSWLLLLLLFDDFFLLSCEAGVKLVSCEAALYKSVKLA